NTEAVQLQADFERITAIVVTEFQVEESMLEHGVPTYYLKQPQQTKQPFLNLLKKLGEINFTAVLRKVDGRIVLKVIPKPATKKGNTLINWLLFFATIATTFITGYFLSEGLTDPLMGGATFTVAIMAVIGTHEMGHKLTADKKGVKATLPYFIPGPPPFGTFGAVIMQKDLPANKDSLFDIGSSGPIAGFIIAAIVTAVGMTMAIPAPSPPEGYTVLPVPLISILTGSLLQWLNLLPPPPPPGQLLFMHPVEFAGWVGMVVTMLNLLPVAMLDGGHVARSLAGEKVRAVLSIASIALLVWEGFWVMAIFVLFLAMQRHPGPLDDVSSLSRGRKLLTLILILIFILAFPLPL
ncbi:MAG: site-2 protease family protein, partial [Candidatus Bathyarchaeales archaeon]